jgi:methionyl-tRNA formyltransferase
MLKVALIGCVDSSLVALQALSCMPAGEVSLVGVITRRASAFNSDFVDLGQPATRQGVPVLYADGLDQDTQAQWLRELAPDVVFCIGWSSLLKPAMLQVARLASIGFHPAALPNNRGRHPIIWALVLGLDRTASSFFEMAPGADEGPIVDQVPITIDPEDDAGSLYRKILSVVPQQIERIVRGLAQGTLVRRPQPPDEGNSWRKRSAEDGRIDWRMSAESVHNLVRGLTRPYPGAHFEFAGGAVKVWRTEVVRDAPLFHEPGKVLAVDGRVVEVKCGSGSVRLLDHEMPELPSRGDYL